MSEADVIEQIIDRAAAAVEAKLKPKEGKEGKAPVQTVAPEKTYFIKVSRRFWFGKTYKVTHHVFAEHEWIQNPATGAPELVSVLPKLLLTHEDGSRTVITNPRARKYRIWR